MLKHCLKNSFSMLALSMSFLALAPLCVKTGLVSCRYLHDCFPKEFLIGIVYFYELRTFGIP